MRLLNLLQNPTLEEQEILSGINYSRNLAVLHEDDREMPMRKSTWSGVEFYRVW